MLKALMGRLEYTQKADGQCDQRDGNSEKEWGAHIKDTDRNAECLTEAPNQARQGWARLKKGQGAGEAAQ